MHGKYLSYTRLRYLPRRSNATWFFHSQFGEGAERTLGFCTEDIFESFEKRFSK